MGLRDTAASDNKYILENSTTGFGWGITVTNPAGTSAALTGNSSDIAELIDPETGQAVSGRLAQVSINIDSLTDAGLGLPVGISNSAIKPWLVTFLDIDGTSYTFKVVESKPDRTINLVTCSLEVYQ